MSVSDLSKKKDVKEQKLVKFIGKSPWTMV